MNYKKVDDIKIKMCRNTGNVLLLMSVDLRPLVGHLYSETEVMSAFTPTPL